MTTLDFARCRRTDFVPNLKRRRISPMTRKSIAHSQATSNYLGKPCRQAHLQSTVTRVCGLAPDPNSHGCKPSLPCPINAVESARRRKAINRCGKKKPVSAPLDDTYDIAQPKQLSSPVRHAYKMYGSTNYDRPLLEDQGVSGWRVIGDAVW